MMNTQQSSLLASAAPEALKALPNGHVVALGTGGGEVSILSGQVWLTRAGVLPMTISWLGNSSVATVPTLLDLIVKGKLEGHEQRSGDVFLFASVGAGMNINAFVYRAP